MDLLTSCSFPALIRDAIFQVLMHAIYELILKARTFKARGEPVGSHVVPRGIEGTPF